MLEVFDVAGRKWHEQRREVRAGDTGVLEWPQSGSSGVLPYRLRLVRRGGDSVEVRGRIVVVR